MVTIVFESHGTTLDNEAHRASGRYDVELSALGEKQAREMGERYKNNSFAAIFCSDLQRSYKSAAIAFGERFPIIKDARLSECDYGELAGHSSDEVDAQKSKYIIEPFPGGKSYAQTTTEMKGFLTDLIKKYDGKRVLIVGHRATQYALENLINHISLEQIIPAPWHWQPGWTYELNNLN